MYKYGLWALLVISGCVDDRQPVAEGEIDAEVGFAGPPPSFPSCKRVDFPKSSDHSGRVIWTGEQFVLTWSEYVSSREGDSFYISGLEGYSEAGEFLWGRTLEVPNATIWTQAGQARVLSITEEQIEVSRLMLDGALEQAEVFNLEASLERVYHPQVLPYEQGLWLIFDDGRVLYLSDGEVQLDTTPPDGDEDGLYHYQGRGTIDSTGVLYIVLKNYLYNLKKNEYLIAAIDTGGDWKMISMDNEDRGFKPYDVKFIEDGFLVLGTRIGPMENFGMFSQYEAYGGRLLTLNSEFQLRSEQNYDFDRDCSDNDPSIHNYMKHLLKLNSGWLGTGSACNFADDSDIWFVQLSDDGILERQTRINISLADFQHGLAISSSGVIALSADHRTCCFDVIGLDNPYIMFIDPEWRCLDEL